MKKRYFKLFLPLVFLVGIGVTIAYFFNTSTFANIFITKKIPTIITKEKFESPDGWEPGDTTPKTITTTNVDSNEPICIRTKFEESWVSKNGNALSGYQNGNKAAIINFINKNKWVKSSDGWYYYRDSLSLGDTSLTPIESVTFNPEIVSDLTCTETTVGTKTTKDCVTSGDGYDGATYTLDITTEATECDNNIFTYDMSVFVSGPKLKYYMDILANVKTTVGILNLNDYVTHPYLVQTYSDEKIKHIERSATNPNYQKLVALTDPSVSPDGRIAIPNNRYMIDVSDPELSTKPIYMWFDTDTIYWYSEFEKPYANENSKYMFSMLLALMDLNSINEIDFSNVTDMSEILSSTGAISNTFSINLDIDTSSVTNMENAFRGTCGYSSKCTFTLGPNFNTTKVTNANYLLNSVGASDANFSLTLPPNFKINSFITSDNAIGVWSQNKIIRSGDSRVREWIKSFNDGNYIILNDNNVLST